MNLLREENPFRPGIHQLSVVTTDLTESEALILRMAQEEQKANPNAFAGKTPCIYCKIPYVPPCETFRELRRLILRIQENTGLRAHFRGIVAMEVTEWLGHEREEYFTVLLKYLYDHRDLWRPALVLNSGTEIQLRNFLCACTGFITPRLFDAKVFSRQDRLREIICQECTRLEKRITREASQMLAEVLVEREFYHVRSLTFLERTARELAVYSGSCGNITKETVRKYLSDPYTMLSMITQKTVFQERSKPNEQQML